MGMQERRQRCRALIQRYYRDVPTREELLDREISARLRPSDVLLDAGCGGDVPLLARYGPKVALAVGVDVSPPVVDLASPLTVVLGDLERLPFDADSVDLVISRSVFEHLARPAAVLREFNRILRSGGALVFTTPNKFYYSCLGARVIPEKVKAAYFRRVFGEDAYDYFPVHYRANTRAAFRRLAAATQLRLTHVEPIRHYPYYLMFSPVLFRLGMLYDWVVTALGFDWLQSNWLVVMEKP